MNTPVKVATVVEARAITREFRSGGSIVHALRGIDLQVHAGEFIALRGRSGSGKTTLINILVGLDNPTSGQVLLLEQELASMNETERAQLRRQHVGIMFQNAHLIPTLTALENVEIPLRLARTPSRQREERAHQALELVGLRKRAHHRGLELSGGEQQRVALARALVHQPRLLVADEPTGNLDSLTGQEITKMLRALSHQYNIGLLIATHDSLIVKSADHVLQIQDGRLSQE